ncbi:MAG: hypothetical protein E7157_04310 [Lactobacillales bacterium]|nr:hypothetical protein [Lactobacillales bacterium]
MCNDLLITIDINKEPYEKIITNDKIINITGESGSGKSTYSKKYLNDDNYIVIDTDEIIGNRPTNNKYCLEIRKLLIEKYGNNIPNICEDFNTIYNDILEYYKDTDKYLIIDSAQFRNLDVNLLKGKIIIIRTCIDECYNRVINRWKSIMKEYTLEELDAYKTRKKGMYEWYKKLNEFIIKIDSL